MVIRQTRANRLLILVRKAQRHGPTRTPLAGFTRPIANTPRTRRNGRLCGPTSRNRMFVAPSSPARTRTRRTANLTGSSVGASRVRPSTPARQDNPVLPPISRGSMMHAWAHMLAPLCSTQSWRHSPSRAACRNRAQLRIGRLISMSRPTTPLTRTHPALLLHTHPRPCDR